MVGSAFDQGLVHLDREDDGKREVDVHGLAGTTMRVVGIAVHPGNAHQRGTVEVGDLLNNGAHSARREMYLPCSGLPAEIRPHIVRDCGCRIVDERLHQVLVAQAVQESRNLVGGRFQSLYLFQAETAAQDEARETAAVAQGVVAFLQFGMTPIVFLVFIRAGYQSQPCE